jgi:hypothetical protein
VNQEQQVKAYPSYLFFTPSGELLRIAVGYRKAPGFIAVGRAVMEEYKSGRSLKTMENKIKSGNYNAASLVDYIKMLGEVRKTNTQAFENYLHTLSDDSLFSVTTRRFVENYYRGWLSSNSLGFSVLLHGYKQYRVRDFELMKPWSIIDGRLRDDLAIAIAQKDSAGMEDIIKSYRKIDSGYQYFQLDKGFVYCYYFAGIGDTHNFMKHLKLFVTNNVTSEKDGTQQRDELKKYKNALKLKFGIDNEKDLPAKDKWFLKSYFCFYRLVLIRLQSIQYEYTHYLNENDKCKNVLSAAMQIAIKNYERYSPNYNKALVGYYE